MNQDQTPKLHPEGIFVAPVVAVQMRTSQRTGQIYYTLRVKHEGADAWITLFKREFYEPLIMRYLGDVWDKREWRTEVILQMLKHLKEVRYRVRHDRVPAIVNPGEKQVIYATALLLPKDLFDAPH